jgi:hypothetical protein
MVSRFEVLQHAAVLVSITVGLASPVAAKQAPGSTSGAERIIRPVAADAPAFALQIPGKKVVIRTTDGSVHHGMFAVSELGLVGGSGKDAVSVPFDQVVTVRKVIHRARYGALIGLAAGVALGALVPVPANCAETSCRGCAFMALYGGIGAGIGAALGGAVTAASRDVDVIYDARPATKSLTIAPILAPGRKGMVFGMTWR